MDRQFANFFTALRGADIRVSVAESLDALTTAQLMGWNDRQALKDALSFTLAKTQREKDSFNDCFEQFFAFDSFRGKGKPGELENEDGEPLQPKAGKSDLQTENALSRMILDRDDAGLAVEMQKAAAEIGVENIRFFTQRGLYTQRIMQAMGIGKVDGEIAAMARGGQGGVAGAQELREARAYLFEQVRDFVEQQLSLQGAAASQELREDRLRRSRLGNLDRRDQEEMKRIVQKIAQRLVALYSRRRKIKNKGLLDVRKTMRRNYVNDGLLFELDFKLRKQDRPKVMAICDVSGSVASVARFLLQFLYELHDIMRDIRSFAFSGYLIETSEHFKTKKVDESVKAILDKVGFMPTDYGESLKNFKDSFLEDIDKKTTVIILGDGRSNFTEPRQDILKDIHDRAKRVLWLNPEPPPLWGTGDSEMRRYSPYCDLVRECNTLNHLERIVGDLLEIAHKAA